MIRFFKNLFKGKDPGPVVEAPYKVEAPVAKVEAVNAQPVVAEVAPVKTASKSPAKKRPIVKREEGGTAKVAKVKAPAKPRAPRTPKAK
jgi:hypothetical protein